MDRPTGLELANVYAALEELKRYEAIGTIEQFAELKTAEESGLLLRLPCKVGERWLWHSSGSVHVVEGFHCDRWAGWSVLFRAENESEYSEDLKAANFVYWKEKYIQEAALDGEEQSND